MSKLKGKVALITGAGRGQGRSHAVRLAQEGADIIALDICKDIDSVAYPMSSEEDLETTAEQVRATGRQAVTVVADVRDLSTLESEFAAAVDELGNGLDVVCANVGVSSFGGVLELSEKQWREMIDVNLTGHWNTCRAAVPHILNTGRGGSVILTSSTMGQMAYPGIAHYVAAKHGVVGLMRAMAVELSPQNVRVNTIHPTSVNTTMIHNDATYQRFCPDVAEPSIDDVAERFQVMNLMPIQWLEPSAISDAVAFLASDEARYITGTTMVVDAGAMLVRSFG